MRELFQKFLLGDDAAFAEIYREANPRLSAYCCKLAGSPEWEDIMQELWERVIALRSKRGLTQTEIVSPLAFLFQMLRNLSVDHFRRNVETAEMTEESAVSAARDTRAPTDIECVILEVFERLSFEDREVLVLNIYSGYTFGEIAEIQGKSVEAVWARASRARKRLREIVTSEAKRQGITLPRTVNTIARQTKEQEAIW